MPFPLHNAVKRHPGLLPLHCSLQPNDLLLPPHVHSVGARFTFHKAFNQQNVPPPPTSGPQCCGILGCFRFTETYYLLLVTRKALVGCLGGHRVYSVAATALVPLHPGHTAAGGQPSSAAEKRWVRGDRMGSGSEMGLGQTRWRGQGGG